MKTWKRFGYEAKDGTLYVGGEVGRCTDNSVVRIMREDDFKKMKRVYDAAMAWHNEKPNSNSVDNVIALQKSCEKARDSRKAKNKGIL